MTISKACSIISKEAVKYKALKTRVGISVGPTHTAQLIPEHLLGGLIFCFNKPTFFLHLNVSLPNAFPYLQHSVF